MPTPYGNLASSLRPGHPVLGANDSTIGNTYIYRASTTLINANTPTIGSVWADGRNVIVAQAFELHGTADISELMVVTSANTTYSGTIGTAAIEQTQYGLRWRPVQKPLEVHPDFQAGGSYALDATARKCIIGWRAEQDPELRSSYQFKQLDSNGEPGTTIDISTESPNALTFIKLLEIGVEEFVDYLPIWRKRGIYVGSNPPTAGVIGQAEAPSGAPAGITADYFFVKSADDVERIGTSSRWRRDEEWEGAILIYADRDNIFPTGEPY